MLSATKNTRPNLTLFKRIIVSLLLISILWLPNQTLAANQATIDRVKKIVMMLNIAGKEFQDGIVDGKIAIAAEYEESQVFLQQAIERFKRVAPEISVPEKSKDLSKRLIKLEGLIKSKVDSQVIWGEVNSLNSELLEIFSIEISKTPITPISMENGKRILRPIVQYVTG